jgi:hypothetical protein
MGDNRQKPNKKDRFLKEEEKLEVIDDRKDYS